MNKKLEALRPFDVREYESIDLDRLVLYSVIELEKMEVELSLENIIVAAFRLFPVKFSLSGYPEYPDSTRVEKALWRSRGKRKYWIGGKTPHGYSITDRTRAIVEQVNRHLAIPKTKQHRGKARLRRREMIIKELKDSTAYAKYIGGQGESVSESELCYLLQGTLDAPKDILRDNFYALREIAEASKEPQMAAFLNWLYDRFKNFLEKG